MKKKLDFEIVAVGIIIGILAVLGMIAFVI